MCANKIWLQNGQELPFQEICEVEEHLDTIKTFTCQLSLSKLAEAIKLKEGKVDFDPAGLLALMFGNETITWIKTAISHVLKAFEHCKNLQSTIIFKIVNLLCPEKSLRRHWLTKLSQNL